MSRKIEYFLKNYFLNFSFGDGDFRIDLICEDEKYYKFKIVVNEKELHFNILKTRKSEVAKKCEVVNTHRNNEFSLVSFYELDGANPGEPLFTSRGGLKIISYKKANENYIEVYSAINIIDEIFHHLSAFEEYERERAGRRARSYFFDDEAKSINEPLVDGYYRFFSDILNSIFEMNFVNEKMKRKLISFNICLTHDVDAIAKNYLTFSRFLTISFLNNLRKFDFKMPRKIYRYLKYNSDFNQIINIMNLEKNFGFKSTFFFYSRVKKGFSKSFVGSHIDPCYNIANSNMFGDVFHSLRNDGFWVGLHSSYLASRNIELLEKELDLLRRCSGRVIRSHRNHFLNFLVSNSPLYLEQIGIKIDTSFYYNNICGFLRHKTCSPFYFYSHLENRILDLVEIPTVIMDSTLFNYLGSSPSDAYKKSIEILEKVKQENGVVCINWHSETSAPEYGWYPAYKNILEWIKENDSTAYTIDEIYEKLTAQSDADKIINQ